MVDYGPHVETVRGGRLILGLTKANGHTLADA